MAQYKARVRVFRFLTSVGHETTDPLFDVVAAEAFYRALPRDDLIAAQKKVCAALGEHVPRAAFAVDRLRALLALDQRARTIVDMLLLNQVSENAPASSFEPRSWQAAFELSRSFGRAHGQFIRSMRDNTKFQGWDVYLANITLRFFQHRQVELLLRPFADEQFTRFSWTELHDAYKFVESHELTGHELPVNRCHSYHAADTTLEREYVHVLLQDLMNGGHFPPHDALWVSQGIPRWSRSTRLELRTAQIADHGFIVDPDGDAGLTRSISGSVSPCLCLDMAPVLKSMREEFASLREASDRPVEGLPLGYGQRRRVLTKLNLICAAERPVIARCGDRKPTALTVEVAVGMSQILGTLRREAEGVIEAPRTAVMGKNEAIMALGRSSEGRIGISVDGASTLTRRSPTHAIDAAHPPLTMVDRSDSGCRLHGPTLSSNPIVPGALIALREEAGSPWTLGVVRRVKKRLAGKRVEIGVEFLGREPRRVILVVRDLEAEAGSRPGGTSSRFAALYLSASAKDPSLPMRTLVLPVLGLAPSYRLSVQLRTDEYAIQLKEPLDEQAEFVWSPFAIIARQQNGGAAST